MRLMHLCCNGEKNMKAVEFDKKKEQKVLTKN
jgi:hypothetical protein